MPIVEPANARTEAFCRVSREMVEILDLNTECPRIDKGTVIRVAFYKRFADVTDSIYVRFGRPEEGMDTNCLILSLNELESYLLNVFRDKMRYRNLGATTDFFEAGSDSLQAITARARIVREIDLVSNVIFEYPNILDTG